MSMIRLLSTLFVAVLLTSPVYGQHPQSTLDKIKATKTISLGYRESSFPFSHIGEDKKPAATRSTSVPVSRRVFNNSSASPI